MSHGVHHGHKYADFRGHIHLTVVIPEVIVTVPAAREMMQWRFLKHVRLRHPNLRYATYDVHQIDHQGLCQFDHIHAGPDTWGTASRAVSLHEQINYRPPILPAATRMEPGAYLRHEREQHNRQFPRPVAEHNQEHADFPDWYDHQHKEEP
jgi:hypothetical protein